MSLEHWTVLPPKPFKSFAIYIATQRAVRHYKDGIAPGCPCPKCFGYGRVQHNEDRDEYEGWKTAPWYKCERCNGNGWGRPDDWQRIYKKVISDWRLARERATKHRLAEINALIAIQQGCSKEQIELLGLTKAMKQIRR